MSVALVPKEGTPPTAHDEGKVKHVDGQSEDEGKSDSIAASIARAFTASLAFLFKRPVRLFRPVKISTWTGLQALASEQGSAVTPRFVRALIRKEGWLLFWTRHVLPPLVINGTVGLALFTTFTLSEAALLKRWVIAKRDDPERRRPVVNALVEGVAVPFVAGAFAGAAQTVLSAPLDNARQILLHRQREIARAGGRGATTSGPRRRPLRQPFTGWITLMRDSLFGTPTARSAAFLDGSSEPASPIHPTSRAAKARAWAARGWSLFSLSIARDSLGFGVFFMVFEAGRRISRGVGLRLDGLIGGDLDDYATSFGGSGSEEEDGVGDDDDRREPSTSENPGSGKRRRSAVSLLVQSILILASGASAGWMYSRIGVPFDRLRTIIWEGRSSWAEREATVREWEAKEQAKKARQARREIRRQGLPAPGDEKACSGKGRKFRSRGKRKIVAAPASTRPPPVRSTPVPRRRHRRATASKGRNSKHTTFSSSSTSNYTGCRDRASYGPRALSSDPVPRSFPSAAAKMASDGAPKKIPSHTPLPRAGELLARAKVKRGGWIRLLFGRSAVGAPGEPAKGAAEASSTVMAGASGRKRGGPTLWSARHRHAAQQRASGPSAVGGRGTALFFKPGTGQPRPWVRGVIGLSRFLPPYAIGFLVYAVANGDLR